MGHHRKHHRHKGHKNQTDTAKKTNSQQVQDKTAPIPSLEIVLKCDSAGCLEAVSASILNTIPAGVKMTIIHSGIGPINKSDFFHAETGSRLIIGFNVGISPKLALLVSEHGVEVRLYEVIYRLMEDIEEIAASLLTAEESENIIGRAKIIELFKSSRKGIIIGCEVFDGRLANGDHFRVITAMGTAYSGKIESLHIENNAVDVAKKGQQVGLKISNFKKARIGDLVESFSPAKEQQQQSWSPRGVILHL